jgi:subtilisin-like proprotein convertase family protein
MEPFVNPPAARVRKYGTKIALAAVLALSVSMTTGGRAVSAVSIATFSATPNVAIPDDGYDGTLASMASSTITAAIPDARFVTGLALSVGIDHTWVGDLTIKLRSPSGAVVALAQRPQGDAEFNATSDDGTDGGTGDGTNLVAGFPIIFGDSYFQDAETIGSGISDDEFLSCLGGCTYHPNRDYAVNDLGHLGDVNGERAAGDWTLYVGDSAPMDTGTLVTWAIYIESAVSAVSSFSSTVSSAIVDDAYNGTLASMTSDSIDSEIIPMSHVVTDVTVEIAMYHQWVGDLTVKLKGPTGVIVTLVERPQGDGASNSEGDDGSSVVTGDSSDISGVNWLKFNDAYTRDPEQLGLGLPNDGVECDHGAPCRFFPNHDQAADGSSLAAFRGGSPHGIWTLYVGDSAAGNLGALIEWRIHVKHAFPLDGCSLAPFSDVPASHPFCTEIKWMSRAGISDGFGDGTYRPTSPVTRQAMAAFMARAGDASLTACASPPFSDVPTTNPFCREIQWMNAAGISTGFSDGTFRPSLVVTRQAMAAFLSRLVGATLSPCTSAPFTDVPQSHPFCKEIAWLRASGVSTGFSDGTYRPTAVVSRQAMSAFIQRVSGVLP